MQIIKNIKERTKLICDYLLINNSDLFDKDWYKKEYGEEEKAKKDPVLHYIQFGWKELRNPSPIFNTYDYLATNPDVLEKDCNPLIH